MKFGKPARSDIREMFSALPAFYSLDLTERMCSAGCREKQDGLNCFLRR